MHKIKRSKRYPGKIDGKEVRNGGRKSEKKEKITQKFPLQNDLLEAVNK